MGRSIMSKSFLKVVLGLGAAILLFAALAVAAKGKSVDIFLDAVLPNGQELKAGRYTVVVDKSADEVQFMKGKTVVAKAPCKCVPEETKIRHNEVRFAEGPDKKQHIQEIRLAGETEAITLPGSGQAGM
jgi:hypothetical protein